VYYQWKELDKTIPTKPNPQNRRKSTCRVVKIRRRFKITVTDLTIQIVCTKPKLTLLRRIWYYCS